MRCFICKTLSFQSFCFQCKNRYLKPNLIKRKLDNLDIYSFYFYDEIEDLILTKHKIIGFKIYKALAKITMFPFGMMLKKFYHHKVYILGIDENIISGYSNIAILTHSMHLYFKILYGQLLIQNPLKYSGKSKEYRLNNPRIFTYSGKNNIDVILIDDVITTGKTLLDAKEELSKYNVNVLFALTLTTTEDNEH